ncbi:MAG: methionyl-tRNA formyltransferase [Lachnospiraceae bacterium]|nr:methionyl-tRNA formyltransferase [Lachnospiraceae bacterium]
MRLVFMGSPDLAAVILKMLYENGCEIVGVVTGTDKSRGRKSTLIPTEVGKLAQELGLPLLKTPRVRRPEDLAWIREKNADAVIVAAFGQLLPAELLKMTKFGCINVHASLLPAYRGAAPIQWSVLDGKTQTGVTIMQMDEGLDTGDILSQTVVPVDEEDTSGTLFEKMAEAGGKLLLETLPAIANGTVKPVKQPAESTTPYAGRITKEMGRIDWSRPAHRIGPWIRGMNPWPCAYTYLDGKMLKIWKASVREDAAERKNSGAEPGTILCAGKEGIEVQTGSGTILLTEVQLEGKKRMNAADFLRGYRIRSDRLGMHG